MKNYLYQDLYNLEDKHWWHISKRKMMINLVKQYNKTKNPLILDVGCGTGKNMEALSSFGKVWGVDSSEEAIKYCHKRGLKNLKLVFSENTKLPANSFNLITILDVLEHTDDNETLNEMRRILKTDGILIITVPAYKWLWSEWDIVLHHRRRYTMKTLMDVLQKNNFLIRRISYMYSFLLPPIVVVRSIKSLFFRKAYPSDFKLSSPFINNLMNKVTDIESFFARRGLVPFGTSITAVAQKK